MNILPCHGHTLATLVKRAATTLANATTAAEVLEAQAQANYAYDWAKAVARFAKAKGPFDEVMSAVYTSQADALEIEAARSDVSRTSTTAPKSAARIGFPVESVDDRWCAERAGTYWARWHSGDRRPVEIAH